MDLEAKLKGKLGPLPVWAWGLIALALAGGAYWYYQRKQSSGSTVGGAAPVPAPPTGTATPLLSGSPTPAGSGLNSGLIANVTQPDTVQADNPGYYVPDNTYDPQPVVPVDTPTPTYSTGSLTTTDPVAAENYLNTTLLLTGQIPYTPGTYAPAPAYTPPAPAPAEVVHEIDPATNAFVYDPTTGGFL